MGLPKNLSLERERTFWGWFDTILAMLVVVGLALHAWGITLNGLVVLTNDNVMPVVTEVPGFVIPDGGTPRVIMEEGNLLFFADRIRIDFPNCEQYIPGGTVGDVVRWWGKYLYYPLEGGLNMVSIGDIMRWVGSVLFLLGNTLLVFAILRRVYYG